MVILKTAPPVMSASGSVGGLTFKHSRSCLCAQTRCRPRLYRSIRQQAVNNALAYLRWYWKDKRTSVGVAWTKLFDALLQQDTSLRKKYPSPFSLFASENLQYYLTNSAVWIETPSFPPVISPPFSPIAYRLDNSIQQLTFQTRNLASGDRLIVSLSFSFSRASNNPHTWTRGSKLYIGHITTSQYWFHYFAYPALADYLVTFYFWKSGCLMAEPLIQRQ